MNKEIRKGDWMQTYTGLALWPLDPRPDEIRIVDIASALSKLCRFGGHCLRFYSVAEHSVLVASKAPDPFKLTALMHDASEAYLVDVPRPVKRSLVGYIEIENHLMETIARQFNLCWPFPDEIKRLDNGVLEDERQQNMADPPQSWNLVDPPIGVTLQFWEPDQACTRFLDAFYAYGGKEY